jgi:DNA-binding transcriptional MerR regulator
MQIHPDCRQRSDDNNIIGAEIAHPVEGQETVEMVAVNDQFGEGDPAQKQRSERGKFDEDGQLGEIDAIHERHSRFAGEGLMPVQARLKSSGISIGDLAREAGVRPSAVRYYEAAGLMPAPPRRSGQRVYGMADVQRLHMLIAARTLGFSIRDLKALAGCDAGELRDAARSRVIAIRSLIGNLSSSAQALEKLADCQCHVPIECEALTA